MMAVIYIENEVISFEEYHKFLTRTDLGSQYPAEQFEERLTKSLQNRSTSVAARDESGKLVGYIQGLTDFAYFLFVTDLGVDRDCEKLGIGSELMKRLRELAGGSDDITAVLVANEDAIPFYNKNGYDTAEMLQWAPCNVWTEFEVE